MCCSPKLNHSRRRHHAVAQTLMHKHSERKRLEANHASELRRVVLQIQANREEYQEAQERTRELKKQIEEVQEARRSDAANASKTRKIYQQLLEEERKENTDAFETCRKVISALSLSMNQFEDSRLKRFDFATVILERDSLERQCEDLKRPSLLQERNNC